MDDLTAKQFMAVFQTLQKETYEVARAHGFQQQEGNTLYVPTKLALIGSEVSEALEWHRNGKPGWSEEMAHELADIVIRTMDLAQSLHINLASAIVEKHAKNKTREFKHGNKLY